MKRTLICLAVLCASLFVPACSTISDRPILAQLAVQYAVVKVLDNNPDFAPRVVEIATFVEENAGASQATTVLVLEQLVRAQINWDRLDAADRILVDALIAAVREELVARLGDGPLTGDNVLVVKQVAGWIKTAALLAQP